MLVWAARSCDDDVDSIKYHFCDCLVTRITTADIDSTRRTLETVEHARLLVNVNSLLASGAPLLMLWPPEVLPVGVSRAGHSVLELRATNPQRTVRARMLCRACLGA